jgi:hypothetical protein
VSCVIQGINAPIHVHMDTIIDMEGQKDDFLSASDILKIKEKLRDIMIEAIIDDHLIIIINWKWLTGGE